MALDGVFLNSILIELKDEIIGGRIDKIHQPEKDEIHLLIRTKNKNSKAVISASSNYPRIHLSEISKSNPLTPPLFCMVLRKHLLGGRIVDIQQPNFERIIIISIEGRDELGDLSVKRLVVEIMGRHSNIILLDHNDIIIDSVKRITEEISRVRQILPGKDYSFPPSQDKENPLLQDQFTFKSLIQEPDDPKQASRLIMNNFTGISRVTSQEIVYRSHHIDLSKDDLNMESHNIYGEKLALSFIEFFEMVKQSNFKPVLLKDKTGRPMDIFPFPYSKYPLELQQRFHSPSMTLEAFFDLRDRIDRGRQRSSHLLKVLNTNLERCQKKHAILLAEYNQAQNADHYRLFGELITANIYQIPKGVDKVELTNYYDPDSNSIEVTLDERKTPSRNAQMYFKKYDKAKKALTMINKQLKETKNEIDYLESQIDNLDKSTEQSEINEIRQELMDEGYIRLRVEKRGSRKLPPSKPHHYISSDNFDIYVGKNNTQNDRLTLKTAEPRDLWLHTKEIPGSHVIVKTGGQEIPPQTLLEAGMLAAYFSKAQNSSNVPVDYCPRKNVRKPNGAKPGMVIYDHYNTMYVTPKENEINILKKVK